MLWGGGLFAGCNGLTVYSSALPADLGPVSQEHAETRPSPHRLCYVPDAAPADSGNGLSADGTPALRIRMIST